MALPFNLQKLPAEALDVLRYLDKTPSADPLKMESGTGLSGRTVGKAIRRLVNYDYIQKDSGGAYFLTTDGKLAARQIAEYDAAGPTRSDQKEDIPLFKRHLSVVMPRAVILGKPTDVYVGVNPPATNEKPLPSPVQLEIKVSAVGGTFGANNLSLEVPPESAAKPGKVALTANPNSKAIRLRIDVFQSFELDRVEPLEKIYFDVPVLKEAPPSVANMAKGADILLRMPS